jgi:hypothetical protein
VGENVLRGSRLGSVSYENERGAEPAPRQAVGYRCTRGHEFRLPFATDAEVPAVWECTVIGCGASAELIDGPRPEAKAVKPARTHWDMLLERRSVDDLEDVLAERLADLREHSAPHRKSA